MGKAVLKWTPRCMKYNTEGNYFETFIQLEWLMNELDTQVSEDQCDF